MKNKIKDYIDLIFADAPDCSRTREAKEEMYANVCDRYDDLIAEGKSEAAAYNISISGIGDISELIDSIRRENGYGFEETVDSESGEEGSVFGRRFTIEEREEIERYRRRAGIMNSVAVAMYIVCWIPVVLFGALSGVFFGGNDEIGGTVGVVLMMLIIAAATAIMIIKSSIKPLCLRGIDLDDDEVKKEKKKKVKKQRHPALKVISGVLWPITVIVYLAVSFSTGAWHLTWIIFLISTAIENVTEAIFELCDKNNVSGE